jgi:protocatechuate 3,4-dioxygenase beta subunit
MKATLLRTKARASWAAAVVLLVLGCGSHLLAAAQAPATISGKVSDGERGLPGISVALIASGPESRGRSSARARTDAEGRYRLEGIKPGRYQVVPTAPAHVAAERGSNWPPGSKLVNVLAGDEIGDVDFRLIEGGVITGRVTDADGQPVVGESITLTRVDRNPGEDSPIAMNPALRMRTTDDRGVYRLYGLPPGRYRVSIGQGGGMGDVRQVGPRRYYQRTFHPGTLEESEARIIEVTAGSEAENVDITVGRPSKTFRAAGRVVYAETGQPAPGVRVNYGGVIEAAQRIASMAGATSDARGEFQLEGLTPGRYAAFSPAVEGSEWYAEPVPFDISSSDTSGIELRLRRGASLSGFVQVEGMTDRAAVARMLAGIRLFGYSETPGRLQAMEIGTPIAVAPDGSFRFTGLRPGKLRVMLTPGEVRGLAISRIEINGASVRDGIQIAEGAQLTGARVVLVYGTSTLRGQVSITGAAPPPNTRLIVYLRRAGGDSQFARTAEVDARGRFQLEGLPSGTYEVQARGFAPGRLRFEGQPQQVFIADGSEQQVALTVALVAAPPANP